MNRNTTAEEAHDWGEEEDEGKAYEPEEEKAYDSDDNMAYDSEDDGEQRVKVFRLDLAKLDRDAKDGVCPVCHELGLDRLLDLESMRKTHSIVNIDFQTLEAAQISCPICQLIYTEARTDTIPDFISVHRREYQPGRLDSLHIYHGSLDDLVLIIKLYADEATFSSRFVTYCPIGAAGSAKSMAKIRKWIAECDQDHPQCHLIISGEPLESKQILATRILDVQDFPNSLHLVKTEGLCANYVALSHCWGGHSHGSTTKSTLSQHQRHIEFLALSKTVQDAIQTTVSIGYSYLWIDSLCIIQDDLKDFEIESVKMAALYENAVCTIAATAAVDGTEGCFRSATSQDLVSLPYHQPEAGKVYLGISRGDLRDNICQGPLNRRGWVLQERLFSRRIIHFAADQMYWECPARFVGDDGSNVDMAYSPYMSPTRALLLFMVKESRESRDHTYSSLSEWHVHRVWARLVRFYTRCQLSRGSDKLAAIRSLEVEISRINGLPFHVGHCFDDTWLTLSGLLWHAGMDDCLSKAAEYRAPSWSWASVDGSIDFCEIFENVFLLGKTPTELALRSIEVHEYIHIDGSSRKALYAQGISLEVILSEPFTTSRERRTIAIRRCDYSLPAIQHLQRIDTSEVITAQCKLEFDLVGYQYQKLWFIPFYEQVHIGGNWQPFYFTLLVARVKGHSLGVSVYERLGIGRVYDLNTFAPLKSESLVLI